MNSSSLYAFTLGRESKLSLAELIAIFWSDSYLDHTDEIALFSLQHEESDLITRFRAIGGSIRMMQILGETDEKRFPTDVIQIINNNQKQWNGGSGGETVWAKMNAEKMTNESTDGASFLPTEAFRTFGSKSTEIGSWKPWNKINFALWVYGGEFRLSDIGLRIKKTLQESGISARLVNTENENIVSAVWKRDKLGRSKSEYNLLHIKGISYIAVTLACQDIDAYTKRDTGKSRDMVVGMMPPKLCQMMINLANEWAKNPVYDPFCGLGTILIEAANMGITRIYGSDISSNMVHATEENLSNFIAEEQIWQERIRLAGGTPAKDFSNFASEIFELDAAKIIHLSRTIGNAHIVSEWYLGEIMQRDSITLDRVKQERSKLRNMYDWFFGGLCALNFSGNIVMTFPFWDIHGTHSFFTEIYDVIGRHGFDIIPLLPEGMRTLMTAKWSLLYKRPGQNVGREVVRIRKR